MSSSVLVTRKTCRLCGNDSLLPAVSLGHQFIGGAFAKPDCSPPSQRTVPLDLVRCSPELNENACGLVQLRHSVPPNVLYASYWYRSGINETMRVHLSDIAHDAEWFVNLKAGDLVVDIGCNDGTLLNSYRTKRIKKLGIDPANVVCHAIKSGLKVVNDFFSHGAFSSVYPKQKAKIITSIAMFYDLENPCDFVLDIEKCLADDGIWVVELSYLPSMLKMNSFDTICHEHLGYYGFAQMEYALSVWGMEAIDVTLNGSNGGSFRIVAAHAGKIKPPAEATERMRALRLSEFDGEYDNAKPYFDFSHNISVIRKDIMDFLVTAKSRRKVVHGYGASTKGNTTLQFCGITPELLPYIADRNPDKFGTSTVGTNIPIISEEESRAMRPDYYLALPWHFIDGFKKREHEFLAHGGQFIVPMPHVHLIGK